MNIVCVLEIHLLTILHIQGSLRIVGIKAKVYLMHVLILVHIISLESIIQYTLRLLLAVWPVPRFASGLAKRVACGPVSHGHIQCLILICTYLRIYVTSVLYLL